MALFLSRSSRKLIHLQRRTTVLELDNSKKPKHDITSSSDFSSDAENRDLKKMQNQIFDNDPIA
jgi:hypothetical protein